MSFSQAPSNLSDISLQQHLEMGLVRLKEGRIQEANTVFSRVLEHAKQEKNHAQTDEKLVTTTRASEANSIIVLARICLAATLIQDVPSANKEIAEAHELAADLDRKNTHEALTLFLRFIDYSRYSTDAITMLSMAYGLCSNDKDIKKAHEKAVFFMDCIKSCYLKENEAKTEDSHSLVLQTAAVSKEMSDFNTASRQKVRVFQLCFDLLGDKTLKQDLVRTRKMAAILTAYPVEYIPDSLRVDIVDLLSHWGGAEARECYKTVNDLGVLKDDVLKMITQTGNREVRIIALASALWQKSFLGSLFHANQGMKQTSVKRGRLAMVLQELKDILDSCPDAERMNIKLDSRLTAGLAIDQDLQSILKGKEYVKVQKLCRSQVRDRLHSDSSRTVSSAPQGAINGSPMTTPLLVSKPR